MPRILLAALIAAVALLFIAAAQPAFAEVTPAQQSSTRAFLREFAREIPYLQNRWVGTDYCGWEGITCDASGNVAIDLAGKDLVGDMPELDSDVDGWQVMVMSIDMSNNPRWSDEFEEDWAGLHNLRFLNLSYTALHDAIPDSWNGMRALEEVHISHTSACKSLPEWTLTTLHTIDLSHNNLQGALSAAWSQMTGLTSVDITGNGFCGCVPSTWTSALLSDAAAAAGGAVRSATCATDNACTYAKLWCVNAPITTATPTRPPGPTTTTTTPNPSFTSAATLAFLREFAREIPYLQNRWVGTDYCGWEGITCDASGYVSVDLAGKDLTGDMPELRSDVDGSQVMVVSIDMSSNPHWSDDFEESWARLANLQHLDLSNTALKGDIPDRWTTMSSLQTVKISNTYACKSLPNWNIASLRTLDLSNNAFSGSLPSSWGRMTGLTSVDISGVFPCGCVPSTWTSPVLTSAAAALGSGVSNANCATVNACDRRRDHCLDYQAAAASLNVKQRHTLAFLQEFAGGFAYLSPRWTGVDYCSWEGITCDTNGNVAIDLAGKDLVGDMPELDSDVDGWQVMVMSIDMSNNPRWSDEFEEDWAGLHNLRFLNLSYTALHDAIPDSWNGMRALEEVHISHTSACKSLPEWTLTTLHTIDLSHNNLQGALSAAWSQMTGLTSVDITGNGFCGCVPSTWTSALLSDAAAAAGGAVRSATCATDNACTYAKLWCVNAPITTATPTRPPGPTTTTTTPNPSFTSAATLAFLREFAREIPYLQNRWVGTDYCGWEGITCDASGYVSVDLAGKDLTGDMPELRSDVDGSQVMVVSIDMSNNPRWSDEFEEDWAGLKVLQHLDLSRTGLYGAIPDAWNGMVSLQTVKISNTYACLGLPNWNIASLRTIDLSNNKLTGNLVSSWGRMTGLTSVDISGNNFCGCLPHEWTSALLVNAATAANRELTSATCYSTRFCTPDDYVCDTTTPTTVPDVVCSVQHCLSCYPGFPNLCQECSSGYNVRADGSCMPSGECAVEHCVQCALASSTRCIQCDEGYVTTRTGTCQRARNGAAAPASVLVAVAAVVVALAAAAYGA